MLHSHSLKLPCNYHMRQMSGDSWSPSKHDIIANQSNLRWPHTCLKPLSSCTQQWHQSDCFNEPQHTKHNHNRNWWYLQLPYGNLLSENVGDQTLTGSGLPWPVSHHFRHQHAAWLQLNHQHCNHNRLHLCERWRWYDGPCQRRKQRRLWQQWSRNV